MEFFIGEIERPMIEWKFHLEYVNQIVLSDVISPFHIDRCVARVRRKIEEEKKFLHGSKD